MNLPEGTDPSTSVNPTIKSSVQLQSDWCYRLIFWGLLCAWFTGRGIRIDSFNSGWQPNFMGYFMISFCASGLVAVSGAYRTVRCLALVLGLLGVAALFWSGKMAVIGIYFTAALNCWMVWSLLGCVASDCLAQGHHDLVTQAYHRRLWYVGSNGLWALLAAYLLQQGGLTTRDALPLTSQGTVKVAVMVIIVNWLAVTIMILSLLHTARLRLFRSSTQRTV